MSNKPQSSSRGEPDGGAAQPSLELAQIPPLSPLLPKAKISQALLRWYDHHARILPWRISPADKARGVRPNPYHVWLSEIMLQQTTVATVSPRYQAFLDRWPTVKDMGQDHQDAITGAWAGLGYYARARNLHKCAQVITRDYNGIFPDTEQELRTLPGIGDYTAAAIAAIAFGRRAIVMDGNIERVTARLFADASPLPKAKPHFRVLTEQYWPEDKPRRRARHGDFAQALMDLGATLCKPRNPNCQACPIQGACSGFASGTPENFPVKAPKKAKPTRTGRVYIVTTKQGDIGVERRPETGLLGGMLGFPGSEWQERGEVVATGSGHPAHFADYDWVSIGHVRHTFTHFHLELEVLRLARSVARKAFPDLIWETPETLALPTVMKKVADLYSQYTA